MSRVGLTFILAIFGALAMLFSVYRSALDDLIVTEYIFEMVKQQNCNQKSPTESKMKLPRRFVDRYGPWALVAGASEGLGAAFHEL